MLTYTDLRPGTQIIMDGEPYVVLDYTFSKKQRQKATAQTKIKSLISGKVVEKAFHPSDSIDEADIDTREVKFLYSNKGEYWFCPPDKPSERFKLEEGIVGNSGKFLTENLIVKSFIFEDKIINISVPIKMELKVTEAPPAVKGNTAQGATKSVTLETGHDIMVPIFINQGDMVRVNTEKGEYVERVSKAR